MPEDHHYTVLTQIKAHKIEFAGRKYRKGSYALMPRHMAVQYKDALRILSREEQLSLERSWEPRGG